MFTFTLFMPSGVTIPAFSVQMASPIRLHPGGLRLHAPHHSSQHRHALMLHRTLEGESRKRSGCASTARCSGRHWNRWENSTSSCSAIGSNASADMPSLALLRGEM